MFRIVFYNSSWLYYCRIWISNICNDNGGFIWMVWKLWRFIRENPQTFILPLGKCIIVSISVWWENYRIFFSFLENFIQFHECCNRTIRNCVYCCWMFVGLAPEEKGQRQVFWFRRVNEMKTNHKTIVSNVNWIACQIGTVPDK